MPARLRPTMPLAPNAIVVGDPGRALLLAQELLEKPKMSNHARGLWGYTGRTAAGEELTIQATGMGGPSAAMVLADLAKLGVSRVVRVGTCAALGDGAKLGELLLASEALAAGGSGASLGLASGEAVPPDPALHERLVAALAGEARLAAVASLDAMPPVDAAPPAAAADMQTVAILACGRGLGVAAAAALIVSEAGGKTLADAELETAAKRAGRAASNALSNLQVEG